MPKWLIILNGVLLATLVSSLIAISWLSVLEFRKVEPEVISFLRDAHSAVNTTSDNINRNCDQGKPCGTIADINQTLHTVRGTFGQVEYSLNRFNKHEDEFYSQEKSLFGHADSVLTQVGSTVGTLNTTIANVDPLLSSFTTTGDALTTEIGEFHRTNYALNAYLTGQPFRDFLADTYGITHNFNSMSSDIAAKTHEFLYPAPCQGKLCTLKRIYTITRDIGPLAEPFYYGVSTYESLRHGQPY